MTLRALIAGCSLGLFVSVFTFFNDHIIRQTFFVGHHLPVSVLGLFLLLLLFVNPLLRRWRSSAVWRPPELILVAALGMAACGWPGSSLMRYFTGLVALPPVHYQTNTNWQSTRVMSYLPGGSALPGAGHITDWDQLAVVIDGHGADTASPGVRRLGVCLASQGVGIAAREGGRIGPRERDIMLDALHACLGEPLLFAGLHATPDGNFCVDASRRDMERGNREFLVGLLPGLVLPAPGGAGVVLAGGDAQDPAIVRLLQGWEGPGRFRVRDIPWRSWLPVIVFWIGLALLVGVASMCLVVIVQPQWKRELLQYPIARFVQEMASLGGGKPPKLFWYGLLPILFLHVVNGLYAWFPQSIQVPLTFDFQGLYSVFSTPFLSSSWSFFTLPTLFPSVLAFAFFLSTQVSFSVGISPVVYSSLYFILVSNGIWVAATGVDPGNFPLMRLGGYVGIVIMMVYVGRRYYAGVVAGSLGLGTAEPVAPVVRYACRILAISFGLCVALMAANGLAWYFGVLLMLLMLMLFLVMARINAETGVFFHQPYWIPAIMLVALFGYESLGPVGVLMVYLVSMMFTGDVRETLMPFLVNACYMVTERERPLVPVSRLGPIAALVIVSLFVSLGATLFFHYAYGIPYSDVHATRTTPAIPFDRLARAVAELSAFDELGSATSMSGLQRLRAARPDGGLLAWFGAGVVLVVGCGWLRTRFLWWPVHPVLFLVWGTFFPSNLLGISFLAGWFLKSVVVRYSGARGYQAAKPLMFGIISGELLAGLLWIGVGVIYYAVTGTVPRSYDIFWGVSR